MYKIYSLINKKNNTVFYIGLTTNEIEVRLCQHFICSKTKTNKSHLPLYAYMRDNNLGLYDIAIDEIGNFDNEIEAKDFEAKSIIKFSKNGQVTNVRNEREKLSIVFDNETYNTAKKTKIAEYETINSSKNRNFSIVELYQIYIIATEKTNISITEMGRMFGVSKVAISKIISGETNRFLPDEYYPLRLPGAVGSICTKDILIRICNDIELGSMTNSNIARKYKTSVDTVKRIKNKTYKMLKYIAPHGSDVMLNREYAGTGDHNSQP